MAKNEWEKVNSDILQILYSVYKKIEQFFDRTILFPQNLSKEEYFTSVKTYKYD